MENVVVIGGGVAGLSAAIYLARADLSPLVFAGSPPGGQLTLTSEVENYPGYESILGAELVEKMRKQAIKFGARIIDENVVKVDFSKKPFKIFTPTGSTSFFSTASPGGALHGEPIQGEPKAIVSKKMSSPVSTKSVIIATGAKALWLGLESEKRLRGKGVSACATCDGFFFRDKTVAVVGGGDTALEEALTLTKLAKKVYLIHRRDSFRASKIMVERVKANSKIEVILNSQIEEITGETRVEGIKLKTQNSKLKVTTQNLKLDGLFIAIGHKPDTEMFKEKIELDEKGYIITSARKAIDNAKSLINLIPNKVPSSNNQKLGTGNLLGQLDQLEIRNFNLDYQTATSVPGVFAAGDCVDYQYQQAAVAAGMGVSAAIDVENFLET